MIPMVSQANWLGFTITAGLFAVAGLVLFTVWEWRGIQQKEPYTKYLRTWFRKHRWFAVVFTLLCLFIFFGIAWLFYHVTFECAVDGGGIGC